MLTSYPMCPDISSLQEEEKTSSSGADDSSEANSVATLEGNPFHPVNDDASCRSLETATLAPEHSLESRRRADILPHNHDLKRHILQTERLSPRKDAPCETNLLKQSCRTLELRNEELEQSLGQLRQQYEELLHSKETLNRSYMSLEQEFDSLRWHFNELEHDNARLLSEVRSRDEWYRRQFPCGYFPYPGEQQEQGPPRNHNDTAEIPRKIPRTV